MLSLNSAEPTKSASAKNSELSNHMGNKGTLMSLKQINASVGQKHSNCLKCLRDRKRKILSEKTTHTVRKERISLPFYI